MNLIKVFAGNFIRFDFIIFLLAVINSIIIVRGLREEKKIAKLLYPSGYLPGGWSSHEHLSRQYKSLLGVEGEEKIVGMRKKMNMSYAIFENITAIFPLMGILGTVTSLIPMVSSINEIETGLFFRALTSTFWGIVFAIAFKALNGYVEAKFTECEKNIQIYIDRNTKEIKRRRDWGKYEEERTHS